MSLGALFWAKNHVKVPRQGAVMPRQGNVAARQGVRLVREGMKILRQGVIEARQSVPPARQGGKIQRWAARQGCIPRKRGSYGGRRNGHHSLRRRNHQSASPPLPTAAWLACRVILTNKRRTAIPTGIKSGGRHLPTGSTGILILRILIRANHLSCERRSLVAAFDNEQEAPGEGEAPKYCVD